MINLYKRHKGKKYYIEFAFHNQTMNTFIWECGLFRRIRRLDIQQDVDFELNDSDAVLRQIEDLLDYIHDLDDGGKCDVGIKH